MKAFTYERADSLARFIEERYRGEPQTAHWGGLASYQWLALVFFLLGTAFMMLHGPALPTSDGMQPVGTES